MPLLDAQLAARLERLTLVARRLGHGRLPGRRLSPRKGRSPEFSDYRDYAEGDDPRFLDWNLFQRLGKPYLKLFLKEEDLQVQLLLDTSASMRNKFEYARQLCAAIGFIALCGGNRLEFLALQEGALVRTPVFHGRCDAERFFAALERLQPGGRALPPELPAALGQRRISGYGVRLLVSDLLGDFPVRDLLTAFCAGRHEAHILHLLSSEEVAPSVSGRLRLRDAETREELICEARDILPPYLQKEKDWQSAVAASCRHYGCGYALLSPDTTMEDTVTRSLLMAGLLR